MNIHSIVSQYNIAMTNNKIKYNNLLFNYHNIYNAYNVVTR